MHGWMSSISHRLAVKTLVFIVLLAAVYWNQERGVKHLAQETHASLCAFKSDLQGRYDAGEQYLADVESGKRKPIPGITVAEIRRQLLNQKATLDSLDPLNC